MFTHESMALLIGNISIQACYCKGYPLMTIFLSNRKSFPAKDLPYTVFIYIHSNIHMHVLVCVFVCMWGHMCVHVHGMCVGMRMHECAQLGMCVYSRLYVCVCLHACVHVYLLLS